MPKVSVIIPVYNVEKYLRECLDSVVNQTLKDIEIICVNDGSTDSSPIILEEYAQKDNRIKVINQENGGLGYARNVGIQNTTSDYIYFLDSDDYIELNALEKLYAKMINLNLDICVCKVREVNDKTTKVDENSINKKYLPPQEVFSSLDVKDTIFHLFIGWVWDKLYKKSVIIDNNLTFPRFKNTEDTAFTYMALILSKRISTIQECLINHRTSISTSMSVTRENEPNAFIKAMDLLKQNLKSKNLYETYKIGFTNYFITFSKWHLDTISKNKQEDLYLEVQEYIKSLNIDKNDKRNFIQKNIYRLFLKYSKYKNYKTFSNSYSFLEYIFSLKNSNDRKHKIVTILGLHIKIKME